MSGLRGRLIRLAQEKPELRPHLLPLLTEGHTKQAWAPMPDDAFSFGYEGSGADAAGDAMADSVKAAVVKHRAQAVALWAILARELAANAKVDSQPGLSRRATAEAFRGTYFDMADEVVAFFKKAR